LRCLCLPTVCLAVDGSYNSRKDRPAVYQQAFLLRLKLLHVVNAMHAYIMTRVSNWHFLESESRIGILKLLYQVQ
ncbi:MAG: hypothetical protein AAF512_22875, partial [Pseudomonadota bacterium]